METPTLTHPAWPLWRRIIFRWLFIYFILVAAPWDWLNGVPGFEWLQGLSGTVNDFVVGLANRGIFHVREELVPLNGSGDTSFGWAQLWTWMLVATLGGFIWSIMDRRRGNYVVLNYWLCVMLRYYLAFVALSYGIAKLFVMQMPFPETSLLATPLGDLLPMRLSWVFLGYSAPYQFFSGLMECLAGLLLLWRRTATLGALFAAGVFMNIAALNLSYDIPVKIFSLQMLLISLFLLTNESRRLICFFLLNRPAAPCVIYHFPLRTRLMRTGRIIAKCLFVIVAIGLTTWTTAEQFADYHRVYYEAFPTEVYDVSDFRRNGIPVTDSTRWQDIALDGKRSSTIRSTDTTLPLTYGRRLVVYDVDTAGKTMTMTRITDDSEFAHFRYQRPDSMQIVLNGTIGKDSTQILLTRRTHRYQLTERQFHWLSEQNR